MKLLSHSRWILGSALAALVAAGCGATDGTASNASAQTVAPAGAGDVAERGHRRGPPDPAAFAQRFDRNHDGRVEVGELPERARERMAAADADHDGVLTAPELTAHRAQMQAQRFARIDADGDGAVTAAEVDPGRWAHLQAADADHDGRVTRAEFEAAHAGGAVHGPGRGGPGSFGHFGGRPHGPPDPARMVERFDRNADGALEVAELPPFLAPRVGPADANHDGVLSVDELRAHMEQHRPGPDAPAPPDSPED